MTEEGSLALDNHGNIGALAVNGGTAINSSNVHYEGFAPESLHGSFAKILEQHQKGNTDAALAQIDLLSSLPHQDPKAQISVDIVSFYLDLLSGKKIGEARGRIIEYLRSNHRGGDLLCDLCLSALVRLDVQADDQESARASVKEFSLLGSHSAEAFYSFLATEEELEEGGSGKYNHDLIALNGVVNGALRLNKSELAQKMSGRMVKIAPSQKSQAAHFFARCEALNSELGGCHYWLLPYDVYMEVNALAEECESLLKHSSLLDKRLPVVGASLIQYMLGGTETLGHF